MSWITPEPKAANDQPGLIYMLQGGSDISATDPWATKTEKFIASQDFAAYTSGGQAPS